MAVVEFSEHKNSPIEHLIRTALSDPQIISLAAGLIDAPAMDPQGPLQMCQLALEEFGSQCLQYTTTQGFPALRLEIAKRLQKEHFPIDQDDLLIGNGSQQILDLINRACLRPGDLVLLESPSYYVYVHALKEFDVQAIHLDMDIYGPTPQSLKSIFAQLKVNNQRHKLKFGYFISHAHNPRAYTMPRERKIELLKIWQNAQQDGELLWIEDGAYRELEFGLSAPTALELQPQLKDCIVYLGSFSKAYAPGFKIGYGVLPPTLLKRCIQLKSNEDFGSAAFSQASLTLALRTGQFEDQVQFWQKHYAQKAKVLHLALLAANLDQYFHWQEPTGGLYIWLEPKIQLDMQEGSRLWELLIQAKVLVVPGYFGMYSNKKSTSSNGMRLSYGIATETEMKLACMRIYTAVQNFLADSNPKS